VYKEMQVLLIGNKETLTDDPNYYTNYEAYLRRVLSDENDTLAAVFVDDIYIGIGDGKFAIRVLPTDCDIQEYDAVMFRGRSFRRHRDLLKAISVYCNANNVAIINDYSHYFDGSKLTQAVQFYETGLPIPYTVLVTPGVLDRLESLELAFPLIMKSTLGARGENNYLVHTADEIREKQAMNPEIRFILQRVIPNDGDYRLLLVGDQVALIHRKAQSGSHLNNTSQGGIATLEPLTNLPEEIVEDARRYTQRYGQKTAGVDVLADKNTGEHYFLEVNGQPQLMSGAFQDEKIELLSAYLHGLQR